MNRTMLLTLLENCKKVILKELNDNSEGFYGNTTAVIPTQMSDIKSARQSYDNAYFYILFVMFTYSFLALTLLRSVLQSDQAKKEPYEEFMDSPEATSHKYGEGSAAEKFEFEEENII